MCSRCLGIDSALHYKPGHVLVFPSVCFVFYEMNTLESFITCQWVQLIRLMDVRAQ